MTNQLPNRVSEQTNHALQGTQTAALGQARQALLFFALSFASLCLFVQIARSFL